MDLKKKVDQLLQELKSGKFNKVILEGEKLLKKHPDKGYLQNICGLAYQRLNNIKTSIFYFKKAIELDPLNPGQKNNLDALCKRYEVDNSQRDLHGALLDAQILLDVYLKMTGGQTDLSFDSVEPLSEKKDKREDLKGSNKSSLIVVEPSESEIEQHHLFLESVKEKSDGKCIWIDNEFD